MAESNSFGVPQNVKESRSLALTPTWSVASVLTIFVAVSLLVERSIHRLCNWLRTTNRKPLLAAVEKMKEELMLLGFISLLLTATASTISSICIPSKFYNSAFTPCTRTEIDEEREDNSLKERHLLAAFLSPYPFRRMLNGMNQNTCKENHEPFVSYGGLEQLHRFIFVMAVTHISYSCLTMLLAIVKIHSWRVWEDEAHIDHHDSLAEIARVTTMRRQSTFVRVHTSNPLNRNSLLIWVVGGLLSCFIHVFFRQFGRSVVRADYLTPVRALLCYMIRSMEEEFQRIVGVSWEMVLSGGFVVAFMLFNVKGSNLYFWIALIPVTLVLLVGTKLQHVIATLALESAGVTGFYPGPKLKPRDELFWFKKPELLLSLIHFILFQNAFELASFFWFWWQFGYNSCFIRNHKLVYLRLVLGFLGQFLCSYSTLPVYALVTQMGSNYKAALIPQRIRETIHGWGKTARRKRRLGIYPDDSTVRTETSTVLSLDDDDDDNHLLDSPRPARDVVTEIELQPPTIIISGHSPGANETSSRVGTPLLRPSTSISSALSPRLMPEVVTRSMSMPARKE